MSLGEHARLQPALALALAEHAIQRAAAWGEKLILPVEAPSAAPLARKIRDF